MIEFGEQLAGIVYRERPGAYAIIQDGPSSVAVLRTKNGFFLPGGGVEPGESFETALQREILEEIGYSADISAKVGSAAQYLRGRSGNKYFRKTGHFYMATLIQKIADPLNMDHQLVWYSPTDAAKKLSHEFQSWAVRQAFPTS
jgi:8-oxo-dGTP diphosphatase